MAERVKITEAVRRTGVPGDVIFLAIRHNGISSERDDRGYDWLIWTRSQRWQCRSRRVGGVPPGVG